MSSSVVAQRSTTDAATTSSGYQGSSPPTQARTEKDDPVAPASEPAGVKDVEGSTIAAGEDDADASGNIAVGDDDGSPKTEGDSDGAGSSAPASQNNLIINYLPSHVTEIELRNMFAVHGDLAHVKVVYDRSTGKSMGYGFVKFTTNEAATAAIAAVNGMAIDRKRIKVSVARPSSKDIKNSKLYVTNLPDHFSQDQVVEVFQQYGKIIECRTLVDPKTTISRCTAFVQFDTRREAKDALKFMNGHSLPGAKKSLLVKFAEDHHRRQQRQEQGQGGRGMDGNGNNINSNNNNNNNNNNAGGGNQYGHQQQGPHQGKGKGGRKGRGGRGGGGGMYRGNNPSMGPRHGHMNHGYLNNMGMPPPSAPDGSPLGQGMMGRYGMQVPGVGPVSAVAAQQAVAAYHVAQQQQPVPGNYAMMHLNNAMGMMNVSGAAGAAAGGRTDASGPVGGGDGSAGAGGGGGGGGGGGFNIQHAGGMSTAGGAGGRTSIMRGGDQQQQQQQHGAPPVMQQQMLSPSGYGSTAGPGEEE